MENKNVGQVLPDNRKNFVENDSCVVGPEQLLLRTSALFNNTPSSGPVLQPTGQALTGHLPPHGEAVSFNTPSTLRERAECVSTGGRGRTTRGFTLIELLVVVLIIGILAAVALPQYQKAVAKARAVKMLAVIDAYQKAIDIHILTNGMPSGTIETLTPQLDIQYSVEKANEIFEYYMGDGSGGYDVSCAIQLEPVDDPSSCMIAMGGSDVKASFDISRYEDSSWSGTCTGYDLDGQVLCDTLKQAGKVQ